MNIDELLRSEPQTAPAEAAGRVFVIRCIPDPFTGESLNIGVCGVSAAGTRVVKVITEAGRLNCLYGDSARAVVNMAAVAKYCLEHNLPSPSEQIVFDDPLPYFNSSVEQVVADAFADQVTVALPQRVNRATPQVDDQAALAALRREMKQLSLELSANEVLPAEPAVLIPTHDSAMPRTVHIPIRPAYGYGAVRSADYSGHSLRGHLLESLLDLSFAGRYRRNRLYGEAAGVKLPALAIFVMHNPQASALRRKDADRVIEDLAPKAAGLVDLVPAIGSADMARAVWDWVGQNNQLPSAPTFN